MDWEEAVIEGIQARQQGDGTNWRIGDLALQMETRYGEHTLETYAEAIGVEYSTLRVYKAVSAAYEFVTRVTNVPWAHYREIYSREDRLDWLKKAAEGNWSRSQMVAEIQQADYERKKEKERQIWAAQRKKVENIAKDSSQPGEFVQRVLEEVQKPEETWLESYYRDQAVKDVLQEYFPEQNQQPVENGGVAASDKTTRKERQAAADRHQQEYASLIPFLLAAYGILQLAKAWAEHGSLSTWFENASAPGQEMAWGHLMEGHYPLTEETIDLAIRCAQDMRIWLRTYGDWKPQEKTLSNEDLRRLLDSGNE
jgi:hypothetical protein